MKKHHPLNTSFEPILQEDEQKTQDKEVESYDTVLDQIVGEEDAQENVEAEYEGWTEEELDDKPPL